MEEGTRQVNKALAIEALSTYARTCAAQAAKMRVLGDDGWRKWAAKGMMLEEMCGQLKRKELVMVEQQVMDV